MKSFKTIIIATAAALSLTACNDYLDIMPENSLPTENMWTKKSDVESALFAGYYHLRSSITSHLIPLGELRAGCVKRYSPNDLDKFEIKPTSGDFTDWNIFYKIIADANGVIANASKARGNDATYTVEEMNSHLCEAYFLRALSYFYLVRNWRDVPLRLTPVESDNAELYLTQSPESEIIAQIKKDLQKAIELGAAKETFDTTWETKGRATIWAIYALMTDVCMWNQEFDEAIRYADMILESNSPYAPRFMATASHSSWFTIFNPGNSEESIFELQYSANMTDGTSYQTNDLPKLFYNNNTTTYMLSENLMLELSQDASQIMATQGFTSDMYVRTRYGSFVGLENSTIGYVWKYLGGTTITEPRSTQYYDPNYIIYRVSEIMLMKAEALVMRQMGQNIEDNTAALAIVNQIRHRTNLPDATVLPTSSLSEILQAIVHENIHEFVAEGRTWYDLLRVGRYKDPTGSVNFVTEFLINNVVTYHDTNTGNIRSVLLDENAWYLPVNSDEILHNSKLVQNPYYE